jgi:hypothetical protein
MGPICSSEHETEEQEFDQISLLIDERLTKLAIIR